MDVPSQPAQSNPTARWVRCPCCGQDALYSPENPHRPFCNALCRQIDFGAWASEEFAVPAAPPDPYEDTGG